MSLIDIKQLSFGYDGMGNLLFDDVDLILQNNWKLGLIGRNGRGKTTFLNILREHLPYEGRINHQLNFTYFPQKVESTRQLTYYVLQELSNFETWRIEKELNLLQVDSEILWREFGSLSGGEQTKVLLALLFVDDINFPLIDEPTNHLDIVARQQVVDYLKHKKQGFILVSHDRDFVDQLVDHILSIEKSQLILYKGNFSVYEEQKALRDQYEQVENEKLKLEIKRISTAADEMLCWSKQRENESKDSSSRKIAKKQAKRAKGILKRTEEKKEEKEILLKNIEYIESLTMNYIPYKHHKRLIHAENFQLSYEKALFQSISFDLEQGQRIAIQGCNGSGKSSIIKYLLGQFDGHSSGEIERPDNLNISYVRQNYEDNQGTLSEFADANGVPFQDLLNNLRKLGFERNVFNNRIENMSMGQKKRVEIAKSLAQPAELYIWDEPLNYLDVFNQQQLEKVIQSVNPTMLIVEHDRKFLENVATEVISLIK